MSNLYSEIINNKKQMVLEVSQDMEYVYPDQEYEYVIYCHNTSNSIIEDVHIKIYSSENILIEQITNDDNAVSIGDLKKQESQLLKLKARCSTPGIYTVYFLCYGKGTGLFTKKLIINCDYNTYSPETIHKIHIYNFTPYEEKYLLQAQDYSDTVARLQKIQKLPYQAKQNPFSFILTGDESQAYLDQNEILYGNPSKTDEHNYQYFDRENFNQGSVEYFEGRNLIELIDQINDNSKWFNAKLLKTGNNELLTDLKQYNPNGFFHRFGLLTSELYQYLGIIPEYSYMNDILFRWAPDNSEPKNLYPKKTAMHWNTKRWAGHGYDVYKVYSEDYKAEIENSPGFETLCEFIYTFDMLKTAQEYINKEYENNSDNIYYIETEDGLTGIKKYEYIIKENYFNPGVFYIHIPLEKIPSNFFIPSTDEILSIAEKAKPYGMKPLIRYISTIKFKHNFRFKTNSIIKESIPIYMGEIDKIRYTGIPYQYHNIEEDICYYDNGEKKYTTRESIRKIPSGQIATNAIHFESKPKLNITLEKPTLKNGFNMQQEIQMDAYQCSIDNDLSNSVSLNELLYQNNSENISFAIKDIILRMMPNISNNNSQSSSQVTINAINYKLWVRALEDDSHSTIWDVTRKNEDTYYISNTTAFNFIELSFNNAQLRQNNVEVGIGFKDQTGKLHGISGEYDEKSKLFNIRYTTSYREIFKIKKQIVANAIGIAYKITRINNQTMVLFFIEQNINGEKVFNFIDHIIINDIEEVFCFIRNEIDISSLSRLSNIMSYGYKQSFPIIFNTPQYLEKKNYNPDIIIDNTNNNWDNITRIDPNEYSYANIHNMSENIISPSDIKIHFDDIDIPDDAIVKDISLHIIAETNSNKSIYYDLRNQDGYTVKESHVNQIAIYPTESRAYPTENKHEDYYIEKYKIAKSKNITSSMKILSDKIKENDDFNNTNGIDMAFLLDDINNYETIKSSFWCDLYNFTNVSSHIYNDIENTKFVIEGYNYGNEVVLNTKVNYLNNDIESINTVIPSGHFIKYIPLHPTNNITIDDLHIKFRFKDIHHNIDIFNLYTSITFKDKQDDDIPFEEYNSIDIENKKTIDLSLLSDYLLGYEIKNGLTTRLSFDNLEIGEYYRIYSIVLNVIYQSQSSDFIANKTNFRNLTSDSNITILNGVTDNTYLSGMFFDDLPSAYQYQIDIDRNHPGIELEDTLYQSFIAEADNITSITLFPNGFIGNPDINLKLGLYSNHGNTPYKLIKEINITGWSKANKELNNKSKITYNFNVNNLNIGEKYWIKLEVDNPVSNNYYILKGSNQTDMDFKLLSKVNNNLINPQYILAFQVNSINLYSSFNNLPTAQSKLNNPNIFLKLNRGQGSISGLKIKKV